MKYISNTNRNEYIDIVKGIAIFLMVLGHCIMNGNGISFFKNQYSWTDPIFRFIYTFHMPLFMLISGYLLYFSLQSKSLTTFIKKRISYILVPIITFNLYSYLCKFSIQSSDGVYILLNLNKILFQIFDGYWFLWGILIWSILVSLIKKHEYIIYSVIFFLLFFIPNFILGISTFRIIFIYPFFIISYLLAKNFNQTILGFTKKTKHLALIFLISLMIFIACLPFFSYESYIYNSGFNIIDTKLDNTTLEQLWNDIFRIVIGLSGSICILVLVKFVQKYSNIVCKKVFVYWGKHSLAIYCIQEIIISYIIRDVFSNSDPNYIMNLFQSILVLITCSIFIELIKKSDILRKIHFGS